MDPQYDREWFPFVAASLIACFSFLFAFYVLWSNCSKCLGRKPAQENDGEVAGDDEEEQNTNARSDLIVWSEICCSYLSKLGDNKDIITLSNAFGKLRTNELTAIMGPR